VGRAPPEVEAKRAGVTERAFPAVAFAHRHQERMVLVEEARIAGEMALEKGPKWFVADLRWDQAVAGQDAARIGVYNKDRAASGVEKN